MPKLRIVCAALLALSALNPSSRAEEPILEGTEWTDVWIAHAPEKDKPRILLVGDSIARAYYPGVEAALQDKAYCARFATSAFLTNPDYLAELTILLERYPFAVIHVNNGLHGYGYTEEQYKQGIEQLLDLLKQKAPKARLVWCLTTPFRDAEDLDKLGKEDERVVARNKIATEICAVRKIPINDLYAPMKDHPEYFEPDGVHYKAEGQAIQAEQVARTISGQLEADKGSPHE